MAEMKITVSRVHAPTSNPLLQHQVKITASFKHETSRNEFADKVEALAAEMKEKETTAE
jgi:hypothetical protein